MAVDQTVQSVINLRATMRFGFWVGNTPPTQFYDKINFTQLQLTPPALEEQILQGNTEADYGETLSTVMNPPEDSRAGFNGQFNRAPRALMRIGMGAELATLDQTGATVSDEAVTLVQGMWVPLAKRYLESFTLLETAADQAIGAENYEVDLINGMIKALNATAVTGTKATYVTKTLADQPYYKAGQPKDVRIMLVGSTTNQADGTRGSLIIHRALVRPTGAWDVVAGGFLVGAIEGSCETPSVACLSLAGDTAVPASPYEYAETGIAVAT
jgi:hypothetical protein